LFSLRAPLLKALFDFFLHPLFGGLVINTVCAEVILGNEMTREIVGIYS
jgi:hypothetical protein